MDERYIKLLRIAAVFGAMIAALKEVVWFDPLVDRQGYSYLALFLTAVPVIGMFVVYRESARKLFRNLDILIPLGLCLGTTALLSFLPVETRWINFLSADWPAQVAKVPSFLYLVWAIYVIVAVVFAGWTIRMILQLGRLERVDAIAAFRGIGVWFWRALVVIALFAFVPVIVFLPLLAKIDSLSHRFVMFLIFASAIVLNFGSFAVLISVLNQRAWLPVAIKNGCQLSLRTAKRLAIPIGLHLLILGIFSFAWLSFSTYEEKTTVTPKTTTVKTTGNRKTITTVNENETVTTTTNNTRNLNYSTDLFWIGSFRATSEWHGTLMKAAESKPFAPVTFKLSLLLTALAILLKIEIVRRIYGFKDDAEFPADFPADAFYGGLIYDDRKIPAPAILLIVVTAVYLLPIEVYSGSINLKPWILAELKERRMRTEFAEEPKLVSPKIYRGEELVQKNEIFRFELTAEEKGRPIGRGMQQYGKNTLDHPYKINVDDDELSFKNINAKFVGEVDDEPGPDILVAGREEGFILDLTGKLKKNIDYKLGTYTSDGTEPSYRFPWIQIVDFDGDGKPEIAGYGLDICQIIDLDGRPVWSYKGIGKGDEIDVDSMTVADVDDDGVNEVIVATESNITVYDQRGNPEWQAERSGVGPNELAVTDFDGDGKSELYADQTIIRAKGRKFHEIEIPVIGNGVIIQPGQRGLVFGFNENQLSAFDLDGQPVHTFEAPLSFVSTKKVKPRKETVLDYLPDGFSIFQAKAARVRLKAGDDKFLVVYGLTSAPEDVCVLYIYDPQGTLIYYETFGNHNDLAITPFPQPDGSEHFLIADDGKLLEYSLK